MEQSYLKSTFREKLVEHLFIGALLKLSWKTGSCSLGVAKPEVDCHGYDIILEDGKAIRHVQLKTTKIGGKAAYQKIHTALEERISGCVVWIYFNEETLELGPYLFFGDEIGHPLPSLASFKAAKHTKGDAAGTKAERPAIKQMPKRYFKTLNTITQVYDELFKAKI
jgi:hypothetical protein